MSASVGTGLASTPPAQAAVEPAAGGAGRARVRAGLVWTLVRTDFKVRYHGTLGGFAWALLKPLAMFAMLMAVFSFLFPDPTYKLDLIIGLFLWDFFAEGTKAGLISLDARRFLLTRARCPSWVLVVTSVANAALTLVVFSALIVLFLAVAGRLPAPGALLRFALYDLALLVIVIGFALGSSVLFLRYRDLNQVWDMTLQAGFFLAPIIYPLAILPEPYHFYLYLWWPTPPIEFSRAVLVDGAVPSLTAHLCLAGVAFATLGIGMLLNRRLGPRAAEYL